MVQENRFLAMVLKLLNFQTCDIAGQFVVIWPTPPLKGTSKRPSTWYWLFSENICKRPETNKNEGERSYRTFNLEYKIQVQEDRFQERVLKLSNATWLVVSGTSKRPSTWYWLFLENICKRPMANKKELQNFQFRVQTLKN